MVSRCSTSSRCAGTLTAHVCEPLPPPTRLRFGASRSLLLATHGLVPPGAPEQGHPAGERGCAARALLNKERTCVRKGN